MKLTLISLYASVVFGALLLPSANGQTPSLQTVPGDSASGVVESRPGIYTVTDLDANSRTWERTEFETNADGTIVQLPHRHKYVELSSGMHYRQMDTNGQPIGPWLESKELIELQPDGSAAAVQGNYQVRFPPDLSEGAIELDGAEGQHLKSRPVGLSYFDGTNSVMFSIITNSIGQILPSGNQCIWTNCFSDGVVADVLTTYRKGRFECDLVIRSQLPAPQAFGLSDNARLELLTEWFDTPDPVETPAAVDPQSGLQDTTLQWGSLVMGLGRAFVIGNSETNPSPNLTVFKSFTHLDGNRSFLIEEMPYANIQPQLQTLPEFAGVAPSGTAKSFLGKVSPVRLLPPVRIAQARTNSVRFAQSDYSRKPGVVWDWSTLSSASALNLQGDSTYYVNGEVDVTTLTIEGGCCVKFSPTNTASSFIAISGPVNCLSAPYHPAVFTSRDDNSCGETIPGSTGNPVVDTLGNAYLTLMSGTQTVVHDLHMDYGNYGFWVSGTSVDASDVQIINSSTPVYTSFGTSFRLRNALMVGVSNVAFESAATSITVENLTVDGCAKLGQNDGSGTLAVTNSLLVGVTNIGSMSPTTNSDVFLSSSAGVFQSAAWSTHYLPSTSPYLGLGTTNVTFLPQLRSKTVFAPIVYSNAIFSSAAGTTTLTPQAQWDTGIPALGYHFDPLDYVFAGTTGTCSIVVAPGTAIGWFRTTSGWEYAGYGLHLDDSNDITFNGTATQPDYWVRCNTVQEADTSAGYGPGGIESSTYPYSSATPVITATFLRCSAIGQADTYFRDDYGVIVENLTHCEFWSGVVGGYGLVGNYTNCLFDRASLWHSPGDSTYPALYFRNCLWHGGVISFNPNSWVTSIRDSVLDGVGLTLSGSTNLSDYAYDGYVNGSNRLVPTNVNDIAVATNWTWRAGPLGNYYQTNPSPFFNKGDVGANLLGLYHFTVFTNLVSGLEVKETNSIVDLGYHYVATDQYGNPICTPGDGIPDYLADANGDGLVESGEISWTNYVSPNGLTLANGLVVFTPLK